MAQAASGCGRNEDRLTGIVDYEAMHEHECMGAGQSLRLM